MPTQWEPTVGADRLVDQIDHGGLPPGHVGVVALRSRSQGEGKMLLEVVVLVEPLPADPRWAVRVVEFTPDIQSAPRAQTRGESLREERIVGMLLEAPIE
ncbi:hypothetical protein ACK389_28955 [Streptomyces antibioticus]|uniref:hypothetical protein n=1 Tax=Streptomyces antibioticus TaxID=1890 RepID=UPI0033F84139